MKFEQYPDRELLMLGLADRLASDLRALLTTQEAVTFCVPGGTTPGPVFDVLSALDLDWGRVAVVLNDERWVPEDSPRSNTRLVRARLLVGKAAQARLVPLYAPAPQPEDALDALTEGLRPFLPLSVLLSGMGADMHTASLLPGADGLAAALAADAPPLLPMRTPVTGEARVTLSLPVLREAMHTHILITGAEKREALERARSLSLEEAPVRGLLGNATVHWAE